MSVHTLELTALVGVFMHAGAERSRALRVRALELLPTPPGVWREQSAPARCVLEPWGGNCLAH